MTTNAGTMDLLETAVSQMGAVVARVRPEQGSQPTPCSDWDVRDVITHTIGHSMPNFTVAAKGGTPDWQAAAAPVPDDWAGAFSAAADGLLAAWRAADMDQMVAGAGGQAPLRARADQQIAELAMHSWDLARATAQDTRLDPALAEHALNWSRPMLKPEYRGPARGFGAEVPVPPDAPAYDRLAGWFGRDPAWQPPGNR